MSENYMKFEKGETAQDMIEKVHPVSDETGKYQRQFLTAKKKKKRKKN